MHQPEPDEALGAPDDRAGAASHLDLLAEPLGIDVGAPADPPVATPGPDVPAAGATRTDTPASDTPGTVNPGPHAQRSESRGPDEPTSDTPGPDTAGADAPAPDAPGADSPGAPEVDVPGDDLRSTEPRRADTTVLPPVHRDPPPTAVLPSLPGSALEPVPVETPRASDTPVPHHAAHVAGPTPHLATDPAQARHRRQPWAVIVLAFLLAVTLGAATYLLVLTRAHEARAQEWEDLARTTGTELAQVRSDLTGAHAELDAVRAQLQTAQARITELADEKAQLGDDREVQRQLVDYQARVSEAAGTVASALETCIDGQYQLIGYLQNPAAYDAADLERFRTDVQQVCGAARDANAALQRELDR